MENNLIEIIVNYEKSYNNFDIGGMTKEPSKNIVFENIKYGNADLKTERLIAF